jgi:preprotein translocase SecE subunit
MREAGVDVGPGFAHVSPTSTLSLVKSLIFAQSNDYVWHEVVLEMKKVSWPTQQEVINTTIIVVIAVFFFALYMFAADITLTYLIRGIEWAASKVFG